MSHFLIANPDSLCHCLEMKPKFTIPKHDRLIIEKDYISNGHWMIHRRVLSLPHCPNPLKKLEHVPLGTYQMGLSGFRHEPGDICKMIIPIRDSYAPLKPNPVGVSFVGETDTIRAYLFQGEMDFQKIAIAPQYVPLLRLGSIFGDFSENPVKAPSPGGVSVNPILITDGTINDDFLAIIMPMRI